MLLNKQHQLTKEDVWFANFGLEREGLRVTEDGQLALTPHPEPFKDNPWITTDFSESQIELITPTFSSLTKTYDSLRALYEVSLSTLHQEWLWPQSMPCILKEGQEIPIAQYDETELGSEAMEYRKYLKQKYGDKKQLISGIHYNFSFQESLIHKLYQLEAVNQDYASFTNQLYLKIVRQYTMYRWFLIYLLGASPVIHESYLSECQEPLIPISRDSYTTEGAISFRNSPYGYQNQSPIYVDYTSVETYVHSLKDYIEKGDLRSYKEFYSPIRLKAKEPHRLMESLLEAGISYLEIRSIDLNPFEPTGISSEDLAFIHLFILSLLELDDIEGDTWQQEAYENATRVALKGRIEGLCLSRGGESIQLRTWGEEILHVMQLINESYDLGLEDLLKQKYEQIIHPKQTLAAQLVEEIKEVGYHRFYLQLAKKHSEQMKVPHIEANLSDRKLHEVIEKSKISI